MKTDVAFLFLVGLLCASGPAFAAGDNEPAPLLHFGMCDASAAVAVGDDAFLVAGDEDNVLRLYEVGRAGAPLATCDLTAPLRIQPKNPESDIEGATPLGKRVYWITSHGRNKNGNLRPNRYRLFATEIVGGGANVSVRLVGKAYSRLAYDIIAAPTLQPLALHRYIYPATEKAPGLAPKLAGLNIEGLAATPAGELLIGFRNPRPDNKALIVPLKNPAAVVDNGEKAQFGEPLLLDLGGLGIRSLEYAPALEAYLLVAGLHTGGGKTELWRWSGKKNEAPKRLCVIGADGFSAEALIVYPKRPRVLLLSDDGTQLHGEIECKSLPDPEKKSFKSLWLDPTAAQQK